MSRPSVVAQRLGPIPGTKITVDIPSTPAVGSVLTIQAGQTTAKFDPPGASINWAGSEGPVGPGIALGSAIMPDETAKFTIAGNGTTNFTISRVRVSDGALTHSLTVTMAAGANQLQDASCIVASDTYVWAIIGASAGNNAIVYRWAVADLTGQASLTLSGVAQAGQGAILALDRSDNTTLFACTRRNADSNTHFWQINGSTMAVSFNAASGTAFTMSATAGNRCLEGLGYFWVGANNTLYRVTKVTLGVAQAQAMTGTFQGAMCVVGSVVMIATLSTTAVLYTCTATLTITSRRIADVGQGLSWLLGIESTGTYAYGYWHDSTAITAAGVARLCRIKVSNLYIDFGQPMQVPASFGTVAAGVQNAVLGASHLYHPDFIKGGANFTSAHNLGAWRKLAVG